MFFLSLFKVSGNNYCQPKVSGSFVSRFLTILHITYVEMSSQNISKVSKIFTYLPHLVPEYWPSAKARKYAYAYCTF